MELTEAQRFRYTKLYRETKRAQMISMILDGFSKADILSTLSISDKFYQSEWKRWKETGSISDRPRSGRPRKLENIDKALVERLIREAESARDKSVSNVTNRYNRHVGSSEERKVVSVSTMRSFWKRHRLGPYERG